MTKKDPNVNYEVEMPEIELVLRAIADRLKALTPHGWGFSLFLMSLGEDSTTFYISSVERADFIENLRLFLDRNDKLAAESASKDGSDDGHKK